MSSENTAAHPKPGQKTLKSYLVGFVLCTVLTLLAFACVQYHFFTTSQTYIALAVLAVTQLLVQVLCFLRLNTSEEGRWNSISFVFTLLIILALVAGSLWIMYNLNFYMMN